MVIRWVAAFGLMAYTMINFAKWMIEQKQKIEDEYSDEKLELSMQ